MADLQIRFKKAEYVLVIVKAEIALRWNNNVTEDYRFYYPYQEVLLDPKGNKAGARENRDNSSPQED